MPTDKQYEELVALIKAVALSSIELNEFVSAAIMVLRQEGLVPDSLLDPAREQMRKHWEATRQAFEKLGTKEDAASLAELLRNFSGPIQ